MFPIPGNVALFLRLIDVSRLFAKTRNYEKRTFETVDECAHSAAVTLKSCSLLIQS